MAIITVKITPNASKNSIEGMHGDALRVRIAAPPDKGKANDELVEFLAERLQIAKSRIAILSGHTARIKRIEIKDLDADAIAERLQMKK